jgi:hypothetical protein
MEPENKAPVAETPEYDPSQPVGKLPTKASKQQLADHDANVAARGTYLLTKPTALLTPAELQELMKGISDWAKSGAYRG